MIRVRALGADTEAWDAFVRARPESTFFHLSAWRGVIEAAFSHRAHYLVAEQDGDIVGALPLVALRTRLFGHRLISNPFCVYGGPVAASAEAACALADGAAALRAELGAQSCEFRCRDAPPEGWLDERWQARDALYVTFRRAIAADDEANLKAVPRKQRAVIRKGIERGLRVTADRNVDVLHNIYAQSVRNLGTPVFSRRYFRILAETFLHDMDVVTVSDGATPVASVLNFYWRDEVIPYYGGGTPAARACAGNDVMYWEVMRRAAARGCRLFDFGRSKQGTGAFAFKKNWGFTPTNLDYRYLLPPGESVPEVNPANPKYAALIAAWKRLPLPVANALGPHLVRGVG